MRFFCTEGRCIVYSPRRVFIHLKGIYTLRMNFLKRVPALVHNSFKLLVNNPALTGINNLNFIPPVLKNTITLNSLHKRGPRRKVREGNKVMEGRPFLKGVILKTLIKKPRKPNSANRKCVLVRLSTGREAVAYVPGIGHNLQEHQFVLVRGGRVKDLPGIKVKCVRGVYDLPHPGK